MAKLEPIVFICFPESRDKGMLINFYYRALPKWVQLYILRWWEKKKNGLETKTGVCPEGEQTAQ